MKGFELFILLCAFASYFDLGNSSKLSRQYVRDKRDAVGALDIVTNNAHPIHAEVKSESTDVTVKPCPKSNLPSNIEMGTVFQVTQPKDALYDAKSLRKSWPITNRLDLIRSITRVITLATLVISGVIEFYPLFKHLAGLYQMLS